MCLLLCALSASCASDTPEIGADVKDALKLNDSKLAHIAAALSGGARMTLAELFDVADDAPFTSAPDATPLLLAMNALDATRGTSGKVKIELLDYNVALLDAKIFGAVPYRKTPTLDARRTALPGIVFGTDADIIGLQEVWLEQDVVEFTRRGEDLGYRAFASDRTSYNDGVMIFVKDAIIAGGTTPQFVDNVAYTAQDNAEFFPGPGIKRGFIRMRFTHALAGDVEVLCTHMQAFPEAWRGRMRQARELGIAAREAPTDALVLVLGDLNAGPFYAKDTWKVPDGTTQSLWFENTIAYPLLLEYGNLVDAAIMGRSADTADDDVQLGLTVKNDPVASIKVPGAAATWCADTPNTTLSGTDCNSLYFEQYAGTEYPARLDHIHVRERADVVASDSALVFTDKRQFGDVTVEPSDHYGVHVTLFVDARP